MSHFDEINKYKFLSLIKMEEPKDNRLKLVISAADTVRENGPSEVSSLIANQGNASEGYRRQYEIYFDSYIGFSVLDESFALPDDSEVFVGRVYCIYSNSNFLNFLQRASFASDDHPGPFVHYGFNCLNHTINVVSADAPITAEVDAS